MEIAKLSAQTREAAGTRAARRLRKQKLVPGVVYGHKQKPESVSVDAHDLLGMIEHGAHVIELDVGGKPQHVLIKDVQLDYLGDDPVHVDFTRVDLSERVRVSVALDFKGTPIGTHEGGVLDVTRLDVEVECLVNKIPENLRVDVSGMAMGDIMHVQDLELPEGMTSSTAADAIICSVRAKSRAAAVEAGEEEEVGEGEEGAEPEIIGRKDKDEGAEE